MFDALEDSAKQIQAQKAWNDGWIAVRELLRYDGKSFSEEVQERLHRLEQLLKPIDLLEQARTFALSGQHRPFDLADDFDDTEDASGWWRRVEETTRKIGARVAQSPDTLKALLPDLVSSRGSRLHIFGRGLADGCSDKHEMFKILRAEIERTPPEKRNISVCLGFLSASAESDQSFYNSTLDSLVSDDVLGQWFPIFQTTSTIDQRGVERLHETLDLGKAQIHTFQNLGWGRAHESISDDELAGLLRKILCKDEGTEVTIEILQMRFHGRTEKSPKISNSLIAVARGVLSVLSFDKKLRRQDNHDHDLADLAGICLNGKDGIAAAIRVAQKLAKAIMEQRVYAFDYPRLLDSLAQAQPIVFLDAFMGNDALDNNRRDRMFSYDLVSGGSPLNQIPDDKLLSWCENDPAVRYPLIASAIQPFTKSSETGKLAWKPVVHAMFERAPDLDAILEHLAHAIWPKSWSDSLADILLSRAVLFQEFYEHDNAKIRAWAKAQYSDLQESIRKQREWEEQRDRKRNERFE